MERTQQSCTRCNGGGWPQVFVLLEETKHYFSVWNTHPSWMNSSKAAHSDTNWGHWHCRATKDRMGNRSSAPLQDESRKQWDHVRKENTSKHMSVVTFAMFDDPFFPGDWKESKSIGALNGCMLRKIFWEEEFLPGDDGRLIHSPCVQTVTICLSHAGLTAFLLACVRRWFAGL